MKRKNILIMPNDIGGGLGHVRRCVQLAHFLQEVGYNVIFLIHKRSTIKHLSPTDRFVYIPLVIDKIRTVLASKIKPIHPVPENLSGRIPYYWEFNSFNYQPLRDGIFTQDIAISRLNRIYRKVNKLKIDLVIGDSHLYSTLLARKLIVPVIQLTRFAIFPECNQFIWWKQETPKLLHPEMKAIFQKSYESIVGKTFSDCSDLLKGDGYLFPGNRGIEPIKTNKPHLFYGYKVSSKKEEKQNYFKNSRPKKILIMMGGGSPRGHLKQIYTDIYKSLANSSYEAIFSDPFKVMPAVMENDHAQNISSFNWLESGAIFPKLDLIIHHGGYGTTMESLWWGVPSIVIPSHTEQEGNGRRLEQLKIGEVFNCISQPFEKIMFKWRTERYSMNAGFNYSWDQSVFLDLLDGLLSQSDLPDILQNQQNLMRAHFNMEKINNFISEFL